MIMLLFGILKNDTNESINISKKNRITDVENKHGFQGGWGKETLGDWDSCIHATIYL